MDIREAVTIFKTLTSEARLSIFRLLVKRASDGLVAREIAERLALPKAPPHST